MLSAKLLDALKHCIDLARFVMDAVSEVFLVDKWAVRSPTDLAWACMLILEVVVSALVDPDPKVGVTTPHSHPTHCLY